MEIDLSVHCSVAANNYLGEAPVWSASGQCLYWINCEHEAELHRWTPAADKHEQWRMPERIGGVVPKQDGGVLLVLASGLFDFELSSGRLARRVASPLPAHVKLHECATDRQGRLWVGAYDHSMGGDLRNPAGGAYFRLDGDTLVPVIHGVTVANGLAFSPDGRILYAADSMTRRVDAYDVDVKTGELSGRREFLVLPQGVGFLDGATVDAEGGYWLALMYGGALQRYLPDGALERTLPLPFSSPTKPAFGGAGLDTLFVTSTKMQVGKEIPRGFDLNGGVFSCKPGFKGIADTPLCG
jgi:sugar lactone lactonase YvrE